MPQRILIFLQTIPGKVFCIVEGSLFAMTLIEGIDTWVKIISALSAVVVAVFTTMHYIHKIKNARIDNKIKSLELEKKEQEWWEEQERKKAIT